MPPNWNRAHGHQFTAIVQGPVAIASSAEVPEANGLGRTRDGCLASLKEAITRVFKHKSEEQRR
jgi:hypothetical protein